MGFLGKLLGRDSSANDDAPPPDEQVECPHVVLVPKWDDAADIGVEARATHFDCATCGSSFAPEVATELRATTAERIGVS